MKHRTYHIAFGGFALAAASLLVLGHAGAATISGHNSNAPVDYSADRIELQDKANRVILAGNVAIKQDDLNMHAGRTTVSYTNDGAIKIQRIDAAGGVQVTRGSESAHGDVAVYDFNRRIITLAGNVGLNRGSDTLNGGRIVIDLDSGLSSIDGRGSGGSGPDGTSHGGRVSGTFSVPKKN